MNVLQEKPLYSATIGLVQINNGFNGQYYFPLAVAMLQAYVETHAQRAYRFLLPIFRSGPIEQTVSHLQSANVVAFSVYLWNLRQSLEIARQLKIVNPSVIIVFGGPQVPNEPKAFLEEHPYVDVVCHGEGEIVFQQILDNLESREWSMVDAVSFLDRNGYQSISRTTRIGELSRLPSPYLSGLMDRWMASYPEVKWLGLWETNRGCPFSCAFCEWGAKTLNRVYSFDMDRLRAEMEWFAKRHIEFVFCCDANFGLLPRDLDIAQMVVDSHHKYGYPCTFSIQTSKSAPDRIYRIQKLLFQHKLSKSALLALQSTFPPALKHIGRANISLGVFHELQRRFQRDGIDTFTDLIIGLPGETYDSFVNGVSAIVRNWTNTRIQFINLCILGNSEMGHPEYRRQHGLLTVSSPIVYHHSSVAETEINEIQNLVVATDTMSTRDWCAARVFAWLSSLLYFDRLIQVPLLLLGAAGLPFKSVIERFMETDAGLPPVLSGLLDFFRSKAADIQAGGPEYCPSEPWLNLWWPPDEYALIGLFFQDKLDVFYREIEALLQDLAVRHTAVAIDPRTLSEAIQFNARIMKRPFVHDDCDMTLEHDFPSLYRAVMTGKPDLLVHGHTRCHINRSEKTWDTWDDWMREVVWFGNKKGDYVYPFETVGLV